MYLVITENLTKYFGRIVALNNLNLHVPKGISGFIGPNAAGKTTTINILAGLVKPTYGRAEVLGLDTESDSLQIRKKVRFMLENQTLPLEMTVEKYMNYVASFYGSTRSEVNYALKTMNLERFKHRLIKSLSAGMMQRLRFAQALIGDPVLIILDEPVANLDPMGRVELYRKILELYKDQKINFLISSHILPELEKIVNWVSIINNGHIIAEGRITDIVPKRRHIEFRVFSSNNRRLFEILRNWGYDVDFEGNFIKTVAKDHWEFYKTLSLLNNFKIFIYKVEVVGTTLDEVFKKVIINETNYQHS